MSNVTPPPLPRRSTPSDPLSQAIERAIQFSIRTGEYGVLRTPYYEDALALLVEHPDFVELTGTFVVGKTNGARWMVWVAPPLVERKPQSPLGELYRGARGAWKGFWGD